jgi:hypothetical protein
LIGSFWMAKQKKHILSFEQAYDFDLIGLCSHHNDYRLAWSINEVLHIQLSKSIEDYIVINKKGQEVSRHSYFLFKDEESLIEYYLIKNADKGKFLIPEKPSIDYFLFVYENHLIDPEDLVQQLRESQSVLGSFLFDPEEIDSTEFIVFN